MVRIWSGPFHPQIKVSELLYIRKLTGDQQKRLTRCHSAMKHGKVPMFD